MVEKQGKQDTGEKKQDREPWTLREFGGKQVWDWLGLLLVPLLLGIIAACLTAWFNAQQDARQNDIEDRRAQVERALAEKRAQDEALQAYLDQMGQLMLDKKLLEAEPDDPVRLLAQARTSTVILRLDAEHNESVTRFLTDSGLARIGEASPHLLTEISLPHAKLSGAELLLVDLSEADLSNALLDNAKLLISDLTEADLSNANLSYTVLDSADLSGAVLINANLRDANLINANLIDADLRDANLRDADLRDADLRDADLRDADLRSADLNSTYLRGANLNSADLSATEGTAEHSSWWRRIFAGGAVGTPLEGADLSSADLSSANLSSTNLSSANLSSADLSSTNLSSADLSSADLSSANLSSANLSAADLRSADLSEADLSGAHGVTKEQVEEQASSLEGATMPNGQEYEDWLKDK